MKRSLLHLLAILLLAGCSTTQSSDKLGLLPSINQSPFPSLEIEKLAEPKVWRLLQNVPCNGYVVMQGTCLDGVFNPSTITESKPDHARDTLARSVSAHSYLRVRTTGSNVPPVAKVYVIFYEHLALDDRVVLIYAEQIDRSDPGLLAPASSLSVQRY